ncbi:hypothetical protein DY000_02006686 [Brassica cretica]|uniref:Uncharacterized protein n=1 Tax=Brassica cretica TaxID=69181 RepID=A0ABQ7C237_BRACR|nr:hypothetical protein DY000_02006686 [Brassica cretica]
MDSRRIDVLGKLGRYGPSRVRALSLRSDRAVCVLGRYGLCVIRWPYLSLSVADLDTCPLPPDNRDRLSGLVLHYVETDSFAGRSLRSDRLSGLVGRYVATGSFAGWSLRGDLFWILFRCYMKVFLGYECLVSMNELRFVQYFTARFLVRVIFTKSTFRKNVHAGFYGYLDVNFVMSVFGPNNVLDIDSVVTDLDPNTEEEEVNYIGGTGFQGSGNQGGNRNSDGNRNLEHRSTYISPNRSTGTPEHLSTTPMESTASCNAVKILTHEEFAAKYLHPTSHVNVRIDRHANNNIDRHSEAAID